ncbi:hypothetical protein C7M56_06565 [Clostridium botulinum]|uniref:Polysaccharide deacetylase family protein n=1 Tax=Clostridium botulinum TaxID=1491 RepID=A0ABC8CT44_CLOBO|nr:hypothetical protein [Clostridium botulinum]AVQ38363.1 hypothetical protein C7M56_06565 [Clostridium botulinum]
MNNIFTYESYKNLIVQMKNENEVYNFKTIPSYCKSGIILRHDVDFDIEKAYILSQIEKNNNVTSTYFILTTSDLYNPNSLKNSNLLREIDNNGFEIGLHFDPSIYGYMTNSELTKKVHYECSILENIIGKNIESISLHCPSIHNKYPFLKQYKNAYSKDFFNPDLYISDSCKNFRGKNIFSFIKKNNNNLIQVLFHPIHFSQNNNDYITTFSNIFKEKINNFDEYMRLNKTYKNEIQNSKLLLKFCDYIDNNYSGENL